MRVFFGFFFLMAPVYLPVLVTSSIASNSVFVQMGLDCVRYIFSIVCFLLGMAIFSSMENSNG